MLKLIKYELIKQKTSKVIIGAILVLLEVVFLASMFLGKEEIMAIAAGMLVFLAAITFVIVGLEEIITYYHDLRDKSGYMLFMAPYNVYEIMGSKILTGFLSIAAAAIVFGVIGFLDVTAVFARYGELQTLFDQMREFFSLTWQVDVDGMLIVWSIIQVVFSWVGMVTSAFLAITLCITIFSGMRCKGLISFVIYCVLNIAVNAVVVQILNWTDMTSVNGMMAVYSIFDVLFAGVCYAATGYILNKELSL